MKVENQIYHAAFKQFLFIVLVLVLGRYSKGVFIAALAVTGCWAALTNKTAFALSMFVLFPALVILNPFIFPKNSSIMSLALRLGPIAIALAVAMASSRRSGNQRLPFGGLVVYLIWAAVSSIGGYVPMISYFKIINFGCFLLGVWYGTQNLLSRPHELFKLRAFMLALVVFFVGGSLLLYPFPAISTLDGWDMIEMGGEGDIEQANAMLKDKGGGKLFCGVTYQSQALSGIVGCCFGWVVCDMLMVEKRIRLPHLSLIFVMPIVLFMTRSRMGFVIFAAFMVVAYFYTMRRIKVARSIQIKIKKIMTVGAFLAVITLIALEISNNTVSKWLRKTDDLQVDNRTLSEAVTESRMGLIEKNIADFMRNPLFGSGFQVDVTHVSRFKNARGLILSAPIEKGLLPLMIIGETGVVGGIIFLSFIASFCLTCLHRRYMASLTLFWVLFAANIGEATFFSPGGPGGVEWIITIVGGFIIDMNVLLNSPGQQQRSMGLPSGGYPNVRVKYNWQH